MGPGPYLQGKGEFWGCPPLNPLDCVFKQQRLAPAVDYRAVYERKIVQHCNYRQP